jgi:predicted esterase
MSCKNLLFLFLAFGFAACNPGNPSAAKVENQPENAVPIETMEVPLEKGVVIKKVINKFDATQSYCIFIPTNADTLNPKAMLFFDPKGDGSIPVKKYKDIAEAYGMTLVGSNDSKNGLKPEQTAAIAKNLVNDVMTRLNLPRERIVASGFSGGARVAVQTAVNENLSGVIGCGAGFPFEPVRSYEFSFIGVVGNEDFNYLELKRLHRKLQSLGMHHQLVVFDGEHEWPTTGRMEIAILSLNNLAHRQNISDDQKVTELLAGNSAYLPPSIEENEIDRKEAAQQQEIAQAFSKRDFQTLLDKIRLLDAKGNGKEQELSNKRLLNFISLMGFLYSEKALGIDLSLAGQYLDIYGKADFDNPDYHYLRACYFAKPGKKGEALAEIKKSVEYGFADYRKMTSDKSLDVLHGEADFIRLADSLKAIQ